MGSIHNFRPYIPLIHYYYKKKIVGPVTQYIFILHKIIIENDHCQKSTVETPPPWILRACLCLFKLLQEGTNVMY